MFGAQYLGSTQLVSERNPPPSTRMAQAQEAVDRVKVKPGMEQAGGGGPLMPPVAPRTQDRPFSAGPHFLPLQAPDGETQPMTDVDLFVSTKRVKVLTAGSQVLATLRRVPGWTRSSALSPSGLSLQEALMDHALQTVSYTADIGPVLVLMARRRLARSGPQNTGRRLYRMICHVFHAEDVSPGWGAAP